MYEYTREDQQKISSCEVLKYYKRPQNFELLRYGYKSFMIQSRQIDK